MKVSTSLERSSLDWICPVKKPCPRGEYLTTATLDSFAVEMSALHQAWLLFIVEIFRFIFICSSAMFDLHGRDGVDLDLPRKTLKLQS